ncbi:MAG: hypothetical protein KatS3mg076_2599 [Candidatus Binatia bacterium]|nr:MAG: hypothetical protein KatS3mg076_2599 [Candidatus Binatia bacterium]
MLARARDPESLRPALEEWLRRKMPEVSELRVVSLRRPGAGLSNETLLLDVEVEKKGKAEPRALVLRLEPAEFGVFPEYDLGRQFRILRCLEGTDVPVPRALWFEPDPSVVGSPFYVMERVEGEIPSEVPPYHTAGFCVEASPDRRARLWWAGIDAMAHIHTLDWRRSGLDFLDVPPPGRDALLREVHRYRRYLEWARGGTPQPVLERALDWLEENAFSPECIALCWGDARLPNLVFREDRVVAVLDWEMAFLGDPEADLLWWIVLDELNSEGYGFPRLAGFPGKDETIRGYEERTGRKVRHAEYYEVFAALRFGAIMARIARRMKELGVPTPSPDFETNNPCTQHLARLLGLPPPGEARARFDPGRGTARIQFHLEGESGRSWYLVARAGQVERREGTCESPDATLRASVEDWEAIRRGELDRTQAFLSGRIRVEGDLSLFMQFEEAIERLEREATEKPRG